MRAYVFIRIASIKTKVAANWVKKPCLRFVVYPPRTHTLHPHLPNPNSLSCYLKNLSEAFFSLTVASQNWDSGESHSHPTTFEFWSTTLVKGTLLQWVHREARKENKPHLMRITEVLSRSSLGWNCTGILTIERGLRTVTTVPGAWAISLLNVADSSWGTNNEGYIKKINNTILSQEATRALATKYATYKLAITIFLNQRCIYFMVLISDNNVVHTSSSAGIEKVLSSGSNP